MFAAATVRVLNADFPNEGFNDPTPAPPVGGNRGTTLGEQRQIAFLYAADVWGQTLTSNQIIRVVAFFAELPCDANSAVLGGAAPWLSLADVPGLKANRWYPAALAEKLANTDIGALIPGNNNFEVFAVFSSVIGRTGCLEGGGWYYGLDTNTPAGQNSFVTVLLHELGHGLGFTAGPTDSLTGRRAEGIPSIWEEFILDTTTGRTWLAMTDAERAASSVKTDNLVWKGLYTMMHTFTVLSPRAELAIAGPNSVRGEHEAQRATFGAPLTFTAVPEILVLGYDTGGPSLTDGCEPFSGTGQRSVRGRIALVDRGTCAFTVKVKNAQNAGAVGVVVANNVPAGLPGMGGADPTITIPSIGITQALGNALRSLPRFSNPGLAGLPVTIRQSVVRRSGTTNHLVRLYAPNPHEQGSSVSHFDTSLHPNQLMEPFINVDLTFAVSHPRDLTFSLLRDIGW
jgi:hypothetical protein